MRTTIRSDERILASDIFERSDQRVPRVDHGFITEAARQIPVYHYRDVLVVAALVRGKRVPRGLDLVFVPPSRQVLDVAASSGALADLLGAGARIVEPDPAILRGEVFVPSPTKGDGLTLSAFLGHETVERAYTASSETLAMAIARGVVHDPKAFRRLPRLKLPRSLPTDDVLIVRPR